MNLWIYQLCSVWPCGLLFRPALIFRKVWKANSLNIECIQYNITPSNSVRHLLCQGKNSTSQCYDVLCSLSIDCKVRRPTVLLNVCLTLCLCLPSCLSAEASTHLNSLAIQQVTINLDSNWAVAAQDFFRHGKSAESLELLKRFCRLSPPPLSLEWARHGRHEHLVKYAKIKQEIIPIDLALANPTSCGWAWLYPAESCPGVYMHYLYGHIAHPETA